ncbi:MAG: capsule assembly Wzi family protein, partial [Balneolaceae bacterium]
MSVPRLIANRITCPPPSPPPGGPHTRPPVNLLCYLFLLAGLTLLFSGWSPGSSMAQDAGFLTDRPVLYNVSTSFLGSTSDTPFWHYTNTSGQIRSGSSVNNLTSLAVAMPFREQHDGIDFSAGAELASRLSDTGNTIHFQQLYGSLQLGVFRLSIGRFYQTIGMTMQELSTGSMMQSRNATPVPKISIDMTRFVDVPRTNGIVQFKGHYSDGKLESDRFVDSPFIHQKSFYLKFNIERMEAIGGFVHNVTWGGTDPNIGRLPQGFSDYLRVVIGKGARDDSNVPTQGQITNKIGNTVAAYDLALRYHFNNFHLIGYRMIYLEDTVSLLLRSFWDGMYGLGYRRTDGSRSLFSGVLYEYMDTIRQDSQGNYPRGRANYYGHSVYRSGWTFNGNVLGNPLLTFDRESGRMVNNMIIAHHLGFDGWLN